MNNGGGRRLGGVVHGFIGRRRRMYMGTVVRARLTVHEHEGWTGVHPRMRQELSRAVSALRTPLH